MRTAGSDFEYVNFRAKARLHLKEVAEGRKRSVAVNLPNSNKCLKRGKDYFGSP